MFWQIKNFINKIFFDLIQYKIFSTTYSPLYLHFHSSSIKRFEYEYNKYLFHPIAPRQLTESFCILCCAE